MATDQLTGLTFVPTVGSVRWIASVQPDTAGPVLVHLLTYGPAGHLTPGEQQLFLEYEPRLPGERKRVQSAVRFV